MTKIPQKIKSQILLDPLHNICARRGLHGHECSGRITWEHAIIFGAKQLQMAWAIIFLCAKGHSVDEWQDVGDLNKEINIWIALNRANNEEIRSISKVINYAREKERLNAKYGIWKPPVFPARVESEINY